MHPKQIGNNWERQVAYILSEWMTGENQKLVAWRNVNSGSLSTKRINKDVSGENIDGDVLCIDVAYKRFFEIFHIEAKSFAQINLCFINKSNQKSNKTLLAWLKAEIEANQVQKFPLMLVKIRDGKTPALIFYPSFLNLTSSFMFVDIDGEFKTSFKLGLLEDFKKENNWENLIKLKN